MIRGKIQKRCMVICLVLGMAVLPVSRLEVQAVDNVTVQGTVKSGTTSELLKLSTKEGTMEIKLDSGTDTSSYKILLPNKKIYVTVTSGSDGYLHAVKITSDVQTGEFTLDTSTNVTVTGTINEKTNDDILYFNTPQGEMQIRLDPSTSMSGCSVLVLGKTYYITCARGSDAYMHAVSISDTATPATSAKVVGDTVTMSVTGTVSDKTKENLLYLSTSGGEMQLVIDSDADTSKGMVLTPGRQLTVSFYRGSDAYLHASTIVGVKDAVSTATIDTSSLLTVSGTVEGSSNENILCLKTDGGKMELKLDAVKSVNKCKVLIRGKKLTVTCGYGSDVYFHAIDITGE